MWASLHLWTAEIMPKPSFPRLPELTEEQMPLTWPPWGDMMDQRSDDIRALVAKEYSPDPPQERSIKEAQLVAGGMAGPM